jgi:undecaprenyl-diphosphatase
MDFLDAVLLGIIQGIAEWLPVSSEALVTLAGRFIGGLEYQEALGMAIWLHSGTMLSAIIYFHKDILAILQSIYVNGAERALLIFLGITTFASAAIALPLLILAFSVSVPDAIATIAIGAFLVAVAFIQKGRAGGMQDELNPEKAIITGIIQGLAVLPGMSRSGLTVSALLAQKFPLRQAFRLSFLMSIPVTFGAQVALPLVKEGFQVDASMVAGSLVAALVGLITIKALMDFAERVNFFKATLALGALVILLGLALL